MSEQVYVFKEDYERLPRGRALRPIQYRINEQGCHEVFSHTKDHDGYVRLCRRVNGVKKMLRLHRIVYEQCVGEIPEGLVVRHSCDQPSCINPNHLSVGTVQDNTDDKTSKGRQARGVKNGRAKLTDSDVIEIRKDTRDRFVIGEEYGISDTMVYAIKNRVNWSHV